MKDIYVVQSGSNNKSLMQFAFYDLEEAKKCRDILDGTLGASRNMSTINVLKVFEKCPIEEKKE